MSSSSSSGDSASGESGFPTPEDIPQPGATPEPGGYPPQGEYPTAGGSLSPGAKPPPGNYLDPGENPPTPYGPIKGSGGKGKLRYRGAADVTFDIGDALRFAWNKYVNNVGAWIGFLLLSLVFGLMVAFPASMIFLAPAGEPDRNPLLVVSLAAVGIAIIVAVLIVLSAAIVRGALDESADERPALRDFLRLTNISQILLATVTVAALTLAGLLLCVVPGLIVGFLSMFTVHFVVDQNQNAIEALKSSWRTVIDNVGPLLLLTVACYLIVVLGTVVIVGFLITIPVSAIALAYAYRRVTGSLGISGTSDVV
ncbi:hypothetical protein [Hoyosella subflava]|uniref:Hypothetical membrane protein n=1 Tax=Hoyosella subflava (strain DSM 45089 / JCM 17490 / NBRC 109087 / DQS3-9A1) TaxID=443218 RepID=F6EN14_HOYSD|nr:hypothetical protein [Hoyosella subflava]AEF39331.1 Hypothetical membrane protein [Hoyosella subflava DQS3-9A1]